VVEGQFVGGETPATILAGVFVAGEDVAAVKFYLASRQAVVEQQTYDAGDGDIEVYGGNPVASLRLEIAFEFADLAPGAEGVIGVGTLFKRNDLCKLAKEQGKGTPYADNADRHIVLVQDKNVTIQADFRFCRKHRYSSHRDILATEHTEDTEDTEI